MSVNQVICFLCNEDELDRERRGYLKAFIKQNIDVLCLTRPLVDGSEPLKIPSGNIKLIVQPDVFRRLPHGLVKSQIPTACFSIDTFEHTSFRIQVSMLFDYAFVFHPNFDQTFQEAGHPKAFCLPHAVESDLFQQPELERIYDIGWVGRLDGKFYSLRRKLIDKLLQSFEFNDIHRHYNPEEMATIYRQSKIVINLSRDDYLEDANLRCFEAMAAGALLIAPRPNEIALLGFTEGVHYVTFQQEDEVYKLVKFYLSHPQERNEIAKAAQALVLEKHTYDNRAKTILDIIDQSNGELFAPARMWKEADIHALYFGYWTANLLLSPAFSEWIKLWKTSPATALRCLPSLIKLIMILLRSSFKKQ